MSHHTAVYDMPIEVEYEGTGCTWTVQERSGERWLQYEVARFSYPCDAWKLRERFLTLKTEDDALAFLNDTGHFSLETSAIPIEGEEPPKPQAYIFRLRDVLEWQPALRELMGRPPAKWGFSVDGDLTTQINPSEDGTDFQVVFGGILDTFDPLQSFAILKHRTFAIQFRWKSGRHEAVIKVDNTLSALLLTIYVDHLRGLKYQFCARKDCGKPFAPPSAHKMKYCSWYCGHLVAVRKSRARARKRSKTKGRSVRRAGRNC